MQNIDFLRNFEKILQNNDFEASLIEANDDFPFDQLLLYLGADYKNREQILQITAQVQELAQDVLKQKDIPGRYLRVQFQFTFPFKFLDETFRDTASLAFFLNRTFEMPGIEINEADNQIIYRYVLLAGDKELDEKLWLAILGIIMLILELFTETIELVAAGKKSFNKILEEVIDLLNKMEEELEKNV